MTSIREMTATDERVAMEMMDRFCHSPTMEYKVDPAIFHRPFQAMVDPAEPLVQGLVLEENGHPVGYHCMCIGYSAEVGGHCLLLDELYLALEHRGKGYGKRVIYWTMEQHPGCIRHCLEVIGENQAARLYERMGLRYLDYKQMVIDRQKGVLGMTKMEETEALRTRADVHYDCCQSVLVPFVDLCGLDKGAALELGANFGSGICHGPTCGAATGALVVLGLAGKEANEAAALMRRSREKNQVPSYANLLRLAKEWEEERRYHCDRTVYETVELPEELLDGE